MVILGVFNACQALKNSNLNNTTLDSTPKSQMEKDQIDIQKYIQSNKLKPVALPSGIHYVITRKGKGDHPSQYAVATVHYKGSLLDGTQFWSSRENGKEEIFQLNKVIDGWMQGVPLLKKGGKALLIIPSELAYGEVGWKDKIPPNETLVFDIELIDFHEPQISIDVQKIKNYLTENNLEMKKTKSGIFYKIEKIGKGLKPSLNSEVILEYTGNPLNGDMLWSTYDKGQPLKISLRKAIKAFGEIVPMIHESGKAKIIVPSDLAYGKKGWKSVIPPDAVLIFDLELVDSY